MQVLDGKKRVKFYVMSSVFFLFLSGLFYQPLLYAKSVFAVASHANSLIKAYHIDSNGGVTYQNTISNSENFGDEVTGLCVWPEWGKFFVGYEGSDKIAWASCKTLTRQSDDEYVAPEVNSVGLAGMTVDTTRQVMYVVARTVGHLYTFEYDPVNNTLIIDYPPTSPNQPYRQLAGLENRECFGIAFQTGNVMGEDYLYVADGTNIVRRYNTQTWQLAGQLDMKKDVISLDVDEQRGILYGGGHWTNNFLVRYDLNGGPNQPATCTNVNLGFGVTDVKIDEASGLLYMLTRREDLGGKGTLEVYDPTRWTTDPNDLIHKETEYDGDYTVKGPGGLGIGPNYKVPRGVIRKTDDKTSCVIPQETITYSIAYCPGLQDETNVTITDMLPEGVEWVSARPNTGVYHERPEHNYVWPSRDVPGHNPNTPGDPNYYFYLTVQVNNRAEPAGELVNKVEMESDEALVKGEEETPVCCWDSGNVIYVKADAIGSDSGTSWADAYTTLQKAISRINRGCGSGSQIWVAKGIYKPGDDPTDSFVIPANIFVYGSFAGWETSIRQRNIKANPTILSGDTGIFDYDYGVQRRRNTSVVTMGGNNSLLDGFIVRDSGMETSAIGYGVFGQNVDFEISHCVLEHNLFYGLYADNGNLAVRHSIIQKNGYDGVRHLGNGSKTIEVCNCQISGNIRNGIRTEYSIPVIRNNQIGFNGKDISDTYYGLYLIYPKTGYDVRNNTVVYNANEGIRAVDPNTTTIRNCILWGNKNNIHGGQLKGDIIARYSCVYDPNNINTSPDSNYNISCDPKFAYDGNPDRVIYHLLPDSNCIDEGDNTGIGVSEKDIDNEDRLMGTAVDMGADEMDPDCAQIYNSHDWNADGQVNLEEFSIFAKAWQSHQGDSAWNPQCNLITTGAIAYEIDGADLVAFLNDWLWAACWRTDIYNPYDWDGDGLVNLHEFQYFAGAWLSTPSDSLIWKPQCNLNGDNVIGLADLILFLDKAPWLWVSDWRKNILRETQAVLPQPQPEPEPQPQENSELNTIEKPSIEQQIADLQDAIAFFENLWETDENIQQEISAEDWQAFMDTLYAQLAELESQLPSGDPNDLFDPNDPNSPFYGMGMMMSQSGFGARGMLTENSVGRQIADLQDSIQTLESAWNDDPQLRQQIQASDWQQFMNELYNSLTELQENDIITQ
jgi:uncharacterized repeat protein (TIGR01451 family)